MNLATKKLRYYRGKANHRGSYPGGGSAAGLVFLFDNKLSGTAGLVLLGSIGVLFLCAFSGLIFGLGEHSGYWPDKPK